MNEMEKYIRENYTPTITESKLGLCCLFKHNEGTNDDCVVYFESAKRGWNKKPIMNRQYVMVDADTSSLLEDLSKHFDLNEENYNVVRKIITDISVNLIEGN
jgi:hypothetical protein